MTAALDRPLVLVADDHAVVRTGCRRLLEPPLGPYRVVEAATGEAALAQAAALSPRAAVLDLGLPALGGLDLLRAVAALDPAPAIVVLTMHEEPQLARRCLEAGARAYVSKADPPERLPAALAAVLAGGRWLGPELAAALASLDPGPALDAREAAIMDRLARSADLPAVAADLGISYKTLTNILVRLRGRFAAPPTWCASPSSARWAARLYSPGSFFTERW
jgi:DNA-binding NarL/FixJ family response regulator